MIHQDDTPGLNERIRPYPKTPPVRNILKPADVKPNQVLAFEGPDGAGKSTQIRLLSQALQDQGHQVQVFSFISHSLIDHVKLRGKWMNWDPYTMALIYTASLADMINLRVLPFLEQPGTVALLDRYIYSIVARCQVRGCDPDWLQSLVTPCLLPHRTIHLHVPANACFERKYHGASSFSYWECGIDVFGDDALRWDGPKEAYRDSFVQYQDTVQEVVSQWLPKGQHCSIPGLHSEQHTAQRILDFVAQDPT